MALAASAMPEDPAVAYNARRNEYLVVWSGDDDTGPLVNDEFEIFAQRLTTDGDEVGANDRRISDMGPNGGTAFSAGPRRRLQPDQRRVPGRVVRRQRRRLPRQQRA